MPNNPKNNKESSHPWRPCPIGQHWVSEHPRKSSKSKKITIVDSHCRTNKSKKDQIYKDELEYISKKFFSNVKERPRDDNLEHKWLGNRYDDLIAGWTKYWNDILKPNQPLDPDLIKAPISTEFSFIKTKDVFAGKKAGKARGLMQVTDWSLVILSDEKGELRNHLINLTQKNMYTPNLSIATGVRWLHRKRETASSKLKRKATWIEAAADYKSYLEDWQKNPDHKQMNKLINLYERLKK